MADSIMFLQWDEQYKVLVDEQGLLVSASTLVALIKEVAVHLKHSELELEAIAARTLKERHPSMVNQFNMDYFK